MVNEDPRTGAVSLHKETKGLDMVRRDWCPLSKRTGARVLDFLLSGDQADVVEGREQLAVLLVAQRLDWRRVDGTLAVAKRDAARTAAAAAAGRPDDEFSDDGLEDCWGWRASQCDVHLPVCEPRKNQVW